MPTILIYIIIIGFIAFTGLLVTIVKTLLKLRKEELCYFPKPIKIEIAETYIPFEIFTYKLKPLSNTNVKRTKFQQVITNNREIFEFVK